MATKQLNDLSRVERSFHNSQQESLFHTAIHVFEFDREEGIRLLRQFPQSTLIDFL